MLEEAAAEQGVTLVKVDVDTQPGARERVRDSRDPRRQGVPERSRRRRVRRGARAAQRSTTFLEELTKPPVAESVADPELQAALAAGDYERAFELLLGRVDEDPDGTREVMVALFGELGHEHPLTVQYRRRLATAIY